MLCGLALILDNHAHVIAGIRPSLCMQLFRNLVGREYRIVHQYDVVPALPPFPPYRHTDLGMWENNGQVRPVRTPRLQPCLGLFEDMHNFAVKMVLDSCLLDAPPLTLARIGFTWLWLAILTKCFKSQCYLDERCMLVCQAGHITG